MASTTSIITIDKIKLNSIKNVIESCNLNFLIGSGLSVPFFETLSNIEVWLTEIDKKNRISPI